MAHEQRKIAEIGSSRIYVYPDRYAPNILAAMLEKKNYEGSERYVVPKVFRKGDRILEIGTATGLVSLECAKVVGDVSVITFEANPQMCADALQNFDLNSMKITSRNGILKNLAHFEGVGSNEKFYIDAEFWASSTRPSGNKTMVEIPCYCLEDEIEKFGANGLVCDIEGGEVDLLTDANLRSINKIVMEIHYSAGRGAVNRMMRSLINGGFNLDFDLCTTNVLVMHRSLEKPY